MNKKIIKILLSILTAMVLFFLVLVILDIVYLKEVSALAPLDVPREKFWAVQSIDTMKYSRDLAREKLNDKAFEAEIERQVKSIAETGANYISIGTPYDDEFIPFLKKWVDAAREAKLKIWFRGNFSGWEGWFNYNKISSSEHSQKIERLISTYPYLFSDGDIFSSCPECENGSIGDPRETLKVEEFRSFITYEYELAKNTFKKFGKDIACNYYSMNGDVAELVMDKNTIANLGGVITVDHYVATSDKLIAYINKYTDKNVNVVLGEFGAPIPDIHGELNEVGQAALVEDNLMKLSLSSGLIGLNYWTSVGGSTALWETDGQARKVVDVIKKYYNPVYLYGYVVNEFGEPLKYLTLSYNGTAFKTNESGAYSIPMVSIKNNQISVNSLGYFQNDLSLDKDSNQRQDIILEKSQKSLFYKLMILIKSLLNK